MTNEQFCQSCGHLHDCQKVYQQLGHCKGPPVVRKVIIAFLLPIGVFIACLAVSGRVFACVGLSKPAGTSVSFAAAAIITFLVIILTKDRKYGS